MTLLHYSDEPVAFDRDRVYNQCEYTVGSKPVGLWVSVQGEDDWESWCRAEGYSLDCLAVVHCVTLRAGARVLWINTAEGIDEFHQKYNTETEFTRLCSDIGDDDFRFRQRPIDWAKVTTDYDGLIIAPYQWSRRMGGPFWYYGWDCAGGVVWDLSAVESFSEHCILRQ